MFHGHLTGALLELDGSNFCPLTVGRTGVLEYIQLENGEIFDFDSQNALATMDRRKNIHFVGDVQFDEHAEPETLMFLGLVQRFQYQTVKSHIESGQLVSYYHDFGEVDGQLPALFLDAEGFPLLIGGNYGVKREGVIN